MLLPGRETPQQKRRSLGILPDESAGMASSRLGIELPICLGEDFDRAWEATAACLGKQSRAYRLFSVAWHGLGYRTVTTGEYANRYASQPPYGTAGHRGNFEEDQALVDYLFNACSALDCIVFAAYAIASGVEPSIFLSDKSTQLRLDRKTVADKFLSKWAGEELTDVLSTVRNDPIFQLLYCIRDVATHRGTLPRTLYVGAVPVGTVTVPSNAKDLPDVWESDLCLGAASVNEWQGQLESLIERAVAGVLAFVDLHPASVRTDA